MAKRKTKKDERKRRLLFLIFLFVLTIAIGGTATYAWFTSNRTVSVEDLDVEVTTVNGLQISADAVNWGAKVKRDDLVGAKTGQYTGAVNQLPTTLGAVSTAGLVTNGYLDMYYGTVETDETTGEYMLTASKQTDQNCDGKTANDCTSKYYVAFDIFIKADTDMDIILTSNSGVVTTNIDEDGDGNPEVSGDRGIQNSARVAFLEEGHASIDDNVSVIQAKKEATQSEIWEPNFNAHTAQGAANARNIYGINSLATDGTANPLTYVGIKANIAAPGVNIKETGTVANQAYFQAVTPLYQTETGNTHDLDFRKLNGTNGKTTLQAGITKFRVYWWVEGQDVDAENNATGTAMKLKLEFAALN